MKKQVLNWNNTQKNSFKERLLYKDSSFYQAFYLQSIETAHMNIEDLFQQPPLSYHYFQINKHLIQESTIQKLYKLIAIHNTIRSIRRNPKNLNWNIISPYLYDSFQFSKKEQAIAELLYSASLIHRSYFQEMLIKNTAHYLFNNDKIHHFSFAFLGNFWYNSYEDFITSFENYVPFQTRMYRYEIPKSFDTAYSNMQPSFSF